MRHQWYAAQIDNTTLSWEVYSSKNDELIAENLCEGDAILAAAAPQLLMALHHAREALLRADAVCDIGRIDAVISMAEGK